MASSEGLEATIYTIKSTAWLAEACDLYSQRCNLKVEELRFLLDGVRIPPQTTALDMGMENGDMQVPEKV